MLRGITKEDSVAEASRHEAHVMLAESACDFSAAGVRQESLGVIGEDTPLGNSADVEEIRDLHKPECEPLTDSPEKIETSMELVDLEASKEESSGSSAEVTSESKVEINFNWSERFLLLQSGVGQSTVYEGLLASSGSSGITTKSKAFNSLNAGDWSPVDEDDKSDVTPNRPAFMALEGRERFKAPSSSDSDSVTSSPRLGSPTHRQAFDRALLASPTPPRRPSSDLTEIQRNDANDSVRSDATPL
ncbi:hypothetical protein FOL47_004274 [Perkinsus chesapeaki]|uniref:Uncharacterized protein n=1 Tax=Perkinsus chesapeaki TaxID=330153 RepID=A0A7J6M3R0_PERCH|nr:hypothetical protein FOL47_004274 [Perkinsus chesapeaki]